jgi:hypothetical protein
MSALSPASLTSTNLAALISANTLSSDPASGAVANSAGSENRGPATNVDLSDEVKALLAKAETDQVVADRLKSLVQAHQTGSNRNSVSEAESKAEVDQAFQHLTGGDGPAPERSQALGPVEPAINFSDHTQIAGFSVSVTADAGSGAFSTVVNGPDGLSFFDKRFGRGDEVSGSEGVEPGITVGSYQAGNVEYVTFTQDETATESVTASSNSQSAAASAAAAHSYAVTFAIDFTTGSIQTTQSDVSGVSATAQVRQEGSSLSVVT